MNLQDQLKIVAQFDVRYFTMAYRICPNCGVEFAKLHPQANVVPHWGGSCKEKEKGATND